MRVCLVLPMSRQGGDVAIILWARRRDFMFCDSHAHLDDEQYEEDRKELIAMLQNNGISLVINIGADIKSSRASVALAESYDFIYASVGLHPYEAVKMTDEDLTQLELLAMNKKVVAIGEIGLDYHCDVDREAQKACFRRQAELAKRLNLPIIVHDREAHKDCVDIVKEVGGRGVFHCYSGSPEMARELIDLGFYISFAGPLTYKNSKNAVMTAEFMPEDKVLVETDCPYLSPEGHRGKRNNPVFVRNVAQKLADIREITLEEAAKITMDNTRRLFGI